MSLRTILAAFIKITAFSWCPYCIKFFSICCIPCSKTRTRFFPSFCCWALGKYSKTRSLKRTSFISLLIPRLCRRFLYISRNDENLKQNMPSSRQFSTWVISSTKALASILLSSRLLWEPWLCRSRERCLFLRLVKQVRWYFASSAVRSPPSILVSSEVSCRSVAILLTLLSASRVLNSWRSPSSFSSCFCPEPGGAHGVSSYCCQWLHLTLSSLLFVACSC